MSGRGDGASIMSALAAGVREVAADLRARKYPDVALSELRSLAHRPEHGVGPHHRELERLGCAEIGAPYPITGHQRASITPFGRMVLATIDSEATP